MIPKRVGFVGLGNMGRHMVLNLMRSGHHLVVHDLRRDAAAELIEAGATWADTPEDLGSDVEVVITSLPGPEQLYEVVAGEHGLLDGDLAADYLVDMGTSSPATVIELGELAAEKGMTVLDAPVSGGVRGARKASLTIMVGGDPDAYLACEPLLRVLGEFVTHVGGPGTGQVTKIVNNYMGLANAVASMEAVTLGAAAGVDPLKLLEVVERSTGSSYMTRTLFPYLILKRNFTPVRFSIDLGVKDLFLALELAEDLGGDVSVGRAAHDALKRASSDGLGGIDLSEYITVLEERIGVEIGEAAPEAVGDPVSGASSRDKEHEQHDG